MTPARLATTFCGVFAVEHRFALRPFADDDLGTHTVLRDGKPLQFRDAAEHLVFQILRLDARAVRSEADAEVLQLTQDLLGGDAVVSADAVEKHEFRDDVSGSDDENQQQREAPSAEQAENVRKRRSSPKPPSYTSRGYRPRRRGQRRALKCGLQS